MNRLIIAFVLIVFVLGQINPLLEYFKSKFTSTRKFENDAFRHINHLFIAIIFLIGAIWLFSTHKDQTPLWLTIATGLAGVVLICLSVITFYIYLNYLLNHRISLLIYDSEKNRLLINGENVDRSEIMHVKWHKVGSKRLLMIWSGFEYLEIFLRNGNRVIISSLLLNPKLLNKFLNRLPLTHSFSTFPLIRKF